MKYRVAIYDLDYEIDAKSREGAIRAAIALYTKMETAQCYRHCSPDRLTRGPTIAEGRKWEAVFEKTDSKSARHLGRWVPCRAPLRSRSINLPQSSPRPLPNQREHRSVPLHLIVG